MSCCNVPMSSRCCYRQGRPCAGHKWRHQLDSKHPSVQAVLPAWLKALLVCHTHSGAVDRRLLQQTTEDEPCGVPATQVARRLQQIGRQQRCLLQHAYLSAAVHQQHSSPLAACCSGAQRLLTQVLLSLAAAAPAAARCRTNAYYNSTKWLPPVLLRDVAAQPS